MIIDVYSFLSDPIECKNVMPTAISSSEHTNQKRYHENIRSLEGSHKNGTDLPIQAPLLNDGNAENKNALSIEYSYLETRQIEGLT